MTNLNPLSIEAGAYLQRLLTEDTVAFAAYADAWSLGTTPNLRVFARHLAQNAVRHGERELDMPFCAGGYPAVLSIRGQPYGPCSVGAFHARYHLEGDAEHPQYHVHLYGMTDVYATRTDPTDLTGSFLEARPGLIATQLLEAAGERDGVILDLLARRADFANWAEVATDYRVRYADVLTGAAIPCGGASRAQLTLRGPDGGRPLGTREFTLEFTLESGETYVAAYGASSLTRTLNGEAIKTTP